MNNKCLIFFNNIISYKKEGIILLDSQVSLYFSHVLSVSTRTIVSLILPTTLQWSLKRILSISYCGWSYLGKKNFSTVCMKLQIKYFPINVAFISYPIINKSNKGLCWPEPSHSWIDLLCRSIDMHRMKVHL